MKNFAKGVLKVTGVIVGAICLVSLLGSLPPSENDEYDYYDDYLWDDYDDDLVE